MWTLLVIILVCLSLYINKYKIVSLKELVNGNKTSLFLSLATKIGVGSIIGVISSIIIGGYSSVLWMILFSLILTPVIYAESKLGNIYKQRINNHFISGPYFIIRYGLNNKVISLISLVIILILYPLFFQMVQINTISNLLNYTLGINKSCVLIIVSCVILLILTFNINDLLNIINKLVPIKCLLFIVVCLYGIVNHINEIHFVELFNFKSIFTGFIIGIKRSIFINEILIGTTSISSGSSNIDNKLLTSYQIIGVYFISIVITLLLTILVIIYGNSHELVNDYNLLIVRLFNYTNGNIGVYLILIILIIFASTTILSGYYILISNITYFIKNNYIIMLIKLVFLISLSISSILNSSFIWKYTDILIFIMIIINTYSIIRLMGEVKYDR